MSTTLDDELDQGAAALTYVADLQRASGRLTGLGSAAEWDARAARLRQRVAWVRELGKRATWSMTGVGLFAALTGPIPTIAELEGETAADLKPGPCCYAQERALGFHSPGCEGAAAPAGEPVLCGFQMVFVGKPQAPSHRCVGFRKEVTGETSDDPEACDAESESNRRCPPGVCVLEPAPAAPKEGTACCPAGARLAADWVDRYKCPEHGWQSRGGATAGEAKPTGDAEKGGG